jgi:hypothetical protein
MTELLVCDGCLDPIDGTPLIVHAPELGVFHDDTCFCAYLDRTVDYDRYLPDTRENKQ